MLKALYEVVSKAGANMSEASRNSVLALIDVEPADTDGKYSDKLPKVPIELIK